MHSPIRHIRIVKPSSSLRTCNNCLMVVVAALAVYILIIPFWPQMSWWLRHNSPVRGAIPQQTVTIERPNSNAKEKNAGPKTDTLIIPRLAMREEVHGGGIASLSKGVWRVPHTSTPDKGGNTVFVGHRFTYAGQSVFYHLDKIKVRDRIGVYWNDKLYEYEVFAIKVVSPHEVSVEANTTEPQLTLYTCTPLWSVKQRLVIQAKLIGGER
jgi:LPXTG-site transpeptidase (sortase) family protein